MILELLEYCLTPCSATARTMGFLLSTVQVQARHRRCKHSWASHLEETRRTILRVVRGCQRRRKVVVLGGGLLHDIPLDALSRSFDQIVLADMVHTLPTRLAARRHPNVQCLAMDVTETAERLRRTVSPGSGSPRVLPESRPMRFVDDPELDLTLSVNLLSQIPHVPGRFLEGKVEDETLQAFLKHLMEAHLDYLCRLPGHAVLITDVKVRHREKAGGRVEEWSALHGIELPPAERSWEWQLAPSPEIQPGIDVSTIVAAYTNWKNRACRHNGSILTRERPS